MSDAVLTEKIAGSDHEISLVNNYALVLLAINKDDNIRMREIAQIVGITERAVQRIVEELISAGYLVARKSGRRNMYSLNLNKRLGNPFDDCPLRELFNLCHKKQ